MPFTRLKISNLYSFKDTELNLSFTRKPVNAPLDYEFLSSRPKFYFKKVCIISGANASGKTSFGRVLLGVQNFIDKKQLSPVYIGNGLNTNTSASFEVDYVNISTNMHNSLHLSIMKDESGTLEITKLKFASVLIGKNESCASTTNKLKKIIEAGKIFKSEKSECINSEIQGLIGALESFKLHKTNYGWHYILSENTETNNNLSEINADVLSAVLKTFDNTIQNVLPLVTKTGKKNKSKVEKNQVEGFSILFANNDKVMIDLDGDITNTNRLSRGTYEAIRISHLLSRLVNVYKEEQKTRRGYDCTYFLDEKMAYTHSELEKLIVTLIISKLGRFSQFFYTTHNYDILSLDLPIHSFIFTKKDEGVTKFIEASSVCKKNDRKLISYVKNDCFGTLPDLSLIEDILFED
ncbi:TPA: ATP-binding protein [Klebsiella michiganensis]|uniref:Predicted ATP-binding protein involved in virulence n=1 Tax=Klebsiella michiganensis TaxID=1134687 RepID=A0A7H4LUU5_9ENTR|nr:ATP-binding protein [Klebsiella aerogenes]MDU4137284.1 ATP-binding protein [Klebsiella michiganensis]STR39921.1 Predicted ATP-binding protein involved in virulence [Klebsiella michiganensis]STV74320.1 Predicted ATP-binding protein involved in virulence [Klebsiella michiganensis]